MWQPNMKVGNSLLLWVPAGPLRLDQELCEAARGGGGLEATKEEDTT